MLKPTTKWLIAGLALLFFIGLLCLPRQRGGRANLALQPPPGVANLPPIRVLLTNEPLTSISVQVDGPFKVTPAGSQQLLWRQERLAKTTVTLTATGFRWGTRAVSVPRIAIIPDGEGAVWVGERGPAGRLHRRGGRFGDAP